MSVLIIGGDRRMLAAKLELEKSGFLVDTLGLTPDDKGDIASADIILLPVPSTRDGVNIACPLTGAEIPIKLLNGTKRGAKVFGGGKLEIINYIDYLSIDEYALKNAALTAEGALSFAIENTDFSLWKSRVLVIGYGRVGKALTQRLSAFNTTLTVSARSARDFTALDALGINHIETSNIAGCKDSFDIVFNTVDIKLTDETAKALSPTLFIDLASRGGFFEGTAEKYGLTYVKLPGIPGKIAPDTAGKIIAQTVIKLLNSKGEKYA